MILYWLVKYDFHFISFHIISFLSVLKNIHKLYLNTLFHELQFCLIVSFFFQAVHGEDECLEQIAEDEKIVTPKRGSKSIKPAGSKIGFNYESVSNCPSDIEESDDETEPQDFLATVCKFSLLTLVLTIKLVSYNQLNKLLNLVLI